METLPPTQRCNVLNRVWAQELGPGGSKRHLQDGGEGHGAVVAQTFTVQKRARLEPLAQQLRPKTVQNLSLQRGRLSTCGGYYYYYYYYDYYYYYYCYYYYYYYYSCCCCCYYYHYCCYYYYYYCYYYYYYDPEPHTD